MKVGEGVEDDDERKRRCWKLRKGNAKRRRVTETHHRLSRIVRAAGRCQHTPVSPPAPITFTAGPERKGHGSMYADQVVLGIAHPRAAHIYPTARSSSEHSHTKVSTKSNSATQHKHKRHNTQKSKAHMKYTF